MPTDPATPADLGEVLRRLRRRQARQTGRRQLSYRDIAERAGCSHGLVGEYFTGRVLPPADRFHHLIRILGATTAEMTMLAGVRDRLEDRRRRPVPRDLPPPQRAFVARAAELDRLDRTAATGRPVVISGMAGVGKTSLALHWAHRAAGRFPDGTLYLNLRGFHPDRAMTAGEALRELIVALGVPGGRVPDRTADAARLYRRTLGGLRVLIVLDNVADAGQVQPLLPPDGCLAVLTCRRRLDGLVVAQDAEPLSLSPLSDREGAELLSARLGASRIAAEPGAAARIVTACGRLPLALAVVAARAAAHPDFTLAAIAGDLDRTAGGLDAMSGGDTTTDVRAAFSWSYRALPDPARRMFRLLDLHPGPDFGAACAAALAATGTAPARAALAELARAGMLVEHRPGRYALHDLLRAYAAELTEQTGRDAAQGRLITRLVHAAHAAAVALNPFRTPIELPLDGIAEPCAGEAAALEWFAAEHRVLLAVAELAGRTGRDREVWQLAWGAGEFLDRAGDWPAWLRMHTAALAAAERLGDPAALAFSHRMVGNAYLQTGRPDDAVTHLERGHERYREIGDPGRAANCLYLLAWAREQQDRFPEGLAHAERAIALARSADDPVVLGFALNMAGHLHTRLGEYDRAAGRCREAIALQRRIDHRPGLAATLDTLGVARHGLGDHAGAAGSLRESRDLHAALGYRVEEAETSERLGTTLLAMGDAAGADRAWRRALRVLDALGHPAADRLRARLESGTGDH